MFLESIFQVVSLILLELLAKLPDVAKTADTISGGAATSGPFP